MELVYEKYTRRCTLAVTLQACQRTPTLPPSQATLPPRHSSDRSLQEGRDHSQSLSQCHSHSHQVFEVIFGTNLCSAQGVGVLLAGPLPWQASDRQCRAGSCSVATSAHHCRCYRSALPLLVDTRLASAARKRANKPPQNAHRDD